MKYCRGEIMSGFENVVGHKEILEYISNVTKEKTLSHAYILNGGPGSGKKMLANLFAWTIQCSSLESKGEPCGNCTSCKQGKTENHPDIIRVTHEKPNTISVDDIRTQVNNTVHIKPYGNPYKIYIIESADFMTVQAQNALLKNIEEPPPHVIFMLLTRNADVLLETIRSRCVILKLRYIQSSIMKRHLVEKLNIPEERADFCVAFAAGNLGQAVALANSEYFDEIREEAIRLLSHIGEMELEQLFAAVKKITDYKLTIQDYLDLMMVWYRDVLLYKATKNIDLVTFREQLECIKKQARTASYEGIEKILDSIDKTKARLKANVNFELAFELLLFTIKENR